MTAVDYFPREAELRQALAENMPGVAPAEERNEPLLGGSIHVRQNRSTTVMAALFAAVTVTLLAALWLGHLAKSETVRGVVSTVTGSSRLEAPRSAVIKEILVRQGDEVRAGDRIASLKIASVTSNGEATDATELRLLQQKRQNFEAEAKRDAALIAQARVEESAASDENRSFAQAFDAQERTIGAGLKLEGANVAKLTGLVRDGYATNDMLDQHRRALLQYERDSADLRMRRVEAQQGHAARLRQLRSTIGERSSAQADAENQIANIDLRIAQIGAEQTLDLVAQTDGEVLTIAGKPGDSVVSGQLVAAIGHPSDEPLLVLDAPAKAVGLARPGQRVVIKYDAFPFKTFGVAYGTITSISNSAVTMAAPDKEKGEASSDPRESQKQAIYRVEVKPEKRTMRAYGEEQAIAIGSTLTAEIVVERRRLIDWILDPIRAMAGRT